MKKKQNDIEKLENVLDTAKKDVKTDSYPMSIGELVGMYESGEIVLRPEYQRYFRWTLEQKSKLIESILIGLPLPSFFMAQDEDGNWEVVDGMQRLSTILDFMGLLKDEHKAQSGYKIFNTLSDDLFYLRDFGKKGWDDFSRRIQLDFKRTKVQLTILMRETNIDAKFELFMRLNSGGTSISGQELRNAILAGDNPEMLTWLQDLAEDTNFKDVTSLAQSDIQTRYDMELVLRFIAFLSTHSKDFKKFNSVDVFLTHVLRDIMLDKNFNKQKTEDLFKGTFKTINETYGKGALKYKTSPGTGKFSIAFFELVALGIAQNFDKLPSKTVLKTKIDGAGNLPEFQNTSGAGKNANYRIPRLLSLGKSHFKK